MHIKHWAGALALCIGTQVLALPKDGTVTPQELVYKGEDRSLVINFLGRDSTLYKETNGSGRFYLDQGFAASRAFYFKLESALRERVNAEAAAQGITIIQPLNLYGDMTLTAKGTDQGKLALGASGMRVKLAGQASGSYGPLSVTCKAFVHLFDIRLEALHDPFTGVSESGKVSAQTSHTTACTTNLDGIPVLGDFIQSLANRLVANKADQLLPAVISAPFSIDEASPLFAFINRIQPGTLMLGTTDVGMYVKNNFSKLYIDRGITIYIASPRPYYDRLPLPQTPRDVTISETKFSATFSDPNGSISLKVNADQFYRWENFLGPYSPPAYER